MKNSISTPHSHMSALYSLGALAIFFFIMILFNPLLYIFDPDSSQGYYSSLIYGACIYITPFLILKRIGQIKFSNFNFKFSLKNGLYLIFMLLCIFAIEQIAGGSLSIINSDFIHESYVDMMYYARYDIFSLLLVVLIIPIFEQLIFRGIILDGLLKRYSPLFSIILSSTLCALSYISIANFIFILPSSLFLGWVYYKSRNILYCIIMSFAINLYSYIAGAMSSKEELLTEFSVINDYGDWNTYALYMGISVITLIGSIFILNRYLTNK